ncbi:hypothetical protein U3516DRAFT_741756 [Neocallimastix sp. 'constans']
MLEKVSMFIDNGIIINHNNFSLTNRNVTSDDIITEDDFDEVHDPVKMRYCTGNEEDSEDLYAAHGTAVASIVSGKNYGVAKNVNIHIIDVDDSIESLIHVLEYIKEKGPDNYELWFNYLCTELIKEGLLHYIKENILNNVDIDNPPNDKKEQIKKDAKVVSKILNSININIHRKIVELNTSYKIISNLKKYCTIPEDYTNKFTITDKDNFTTINMKIEEDINKLAYIQQWNSYDQPQNDPMEIDYAGNFHKNKRNNNKRNYQAKKEDKKYCYICNKNNHNTSDCLFNELNKISKGTYYTGIIKKYNINEQYNANIDYEDIKTLFKNNINYSHKLVYLINYKNNESRTLTESINNIPVKITLIDNLYKTIGPFLSNSSNESLITAIHDDLIKENIKSNIMKINKLNNESKLWHRRLESKYIDCKIAKLKRFPHNKETPKATKMLEIYTNIKIYKSENAKKYRNKKLTRFCKDNGMNKNLFTSLQSRK